MFSSSALALFLIDFISCAIFLIVLFCHHEQRKAFEWHPDRNRGKPTEKEATDKFRRIKEAYDRLNEVRRSSGICDRRKISSPLILNCSILQEPMLTLLFLRISARQNDPEPMAVASSCSTRGCSCGSCGGPEYFFGRGGPFGGPFGDPWSYDDFREVRPHRWDAVARSCTVVVCIPCALHAQTRIFPDALPCLNLLHTNVVPPSSQPSTVSRGLLARPVGGSQVRKAVSNHPPPAS